MSTAIRKRSVVLLIGLVTLGLAVLLLSCALMLLVSEKYFFDKILYQKSCSHGYMPSNNIFCRFLHLPRRIDYYRLLNAKLSQSPIPKHKYRVVLIGDSFFYGYGSRYSQTIAPVLKQKLQKHQPTEVWNLSYPGDNLIENYTKYLSAKQFLQPDLIIIGMVDNDLIIHEDGGLTYPEFSQAAVFADLTSHCQMPLATVSQKSFAAEWSEVVDTVFLPASSPQYGNVCLLGEIGRRLGSDQRILWMNLTLQPGSNQCFAEENLSGQDENYRTISYDYQANIQNQGGYVIDVLDQGKSVSETVSPTEGHPSTKTHRWYADLIEKELLTNPRWGYLDWK
jgi:hypothetical protein